MSPRPALPAIRLVVAVGSLGMGRCNQNRLQLICRLLRSSRAELEDLKVLDAILLHRSVQGIVLEAVRGVKVLGPTLRQRTLGLADIALAIDLVADEVDGHLPQYWKV